MFERLTNRTKYGVAYTKIPANESNMVEVGECYTGRIVDRIAAYEDSGLSPEEVYELAVKWQGKELNRHIQELLTLEKQGQLIKLPCKVGDTIYVLTTDSLEGIEETVVNRICIKKNRIILNADCQHDDWGRAAWELKPSDFGKTVHLTREAAEKALGGGEG